jgi:hypothetical protein
MVSGDVFSGGNCIVSPGTDVDSFQFTAAKGHIYRLALSLDGEPYPKNICLDLYAPDHSKPFSGCSDTWRGRLSVVTDQTIPVAGTYTMVITESGSDETAKYALSIERLHPLPPDAQQLISGKPVVDEINPLTDMDAFTFWGGTAGLYRLVATIATGGYPANLCFEIFGTGASPVGGRMCTDTWRGRNSAQMDFSLPQTGNYLVLITEASYSRTIGYNLNLACLTPECPPPPPCILNETLTYNPDNNRLTMRFVIAHQYAAHWTTWLTYGTTVKRLWTVERPLTKEPVEVIRRLPNLPEVGRAGVLSTLTTPERGITCSTWRLTETGAPETSSNLDAIVDSAISQIE